MVRVDPLLAKEGVAFLAPQRETESREPEGPQDSTRTISAFGLAARKPHVHDAVAAAGVPEKPRVVTADREFPAQIA